QTLHLDDGSVRITGTAAGVTARVHIWVDVYRPVIHLELNSDRAIRADAVYESWRTADRVMVGRANNANSYKLAGAHAPGGQVITRRDSIRFSRNGVLFYHRNRPGPTVFDVTVHQQGLDSVKAEINDPLRNRTFGGILVGAGMTPAGKVHGRYLDTEYDGWCLDSRRPAKTFRIDCYLATAQTPDVSGWDSLLDATIRDAAAHRQSARDSAAAWWHRFWERSFIFPGSDSLRWQAGRNYQLFRYMLGCNAYGQYPTKFNGGLFTFDPCLTDTTLHYTPDYRNWGGGTMTAQNQRLVYYPMLRSGDFDMMRSEFLFYTRAQKAAELRSRVYWGHGGACFTEQTEEFGLPDNAEYGWDMPPGHDRGVEYNAWLEYEWDTVLEFCSMMLQTERYTGQDIT